MRRRYVAFVNPMTRGNVSKLIETLHQEAESGIVLDMHETTRDPIDPALIPQSAGVEAVIAIGGDGTVAEVATALGDCKIPLGIIPAGSTNIVAKYLGIPSDPAAAARLIFGTHRVHTIDAGVCEGKRFLHMAGAGFDSRLFLATNRSLKRRMGWLAYMTGAARSVFLPPARFTVDVDGNTIELVSPLVLVANGAAIIHPRLSIYPHIDNDDGLLDVIIFSATNTRAVLRALARFATGSLSQSGDVIRLQGRVIKLESDPKMPVQLDGDVIRETPAVFSIAAKAIRIIVPVDAP